MNEPEIKDLEGDFSNWLTVNISSLKSEDRAVRLNFLKDLYKKLNNSSINFDDEHFKEIFDASYEPLIISFQDRVEKCREVSTTVFNFLLLKQSSLDDKCVSLLLNTLSTCIGPSDERDDSEEVRLIEVRILSDVVRMLETNVKYMNEVIHILSGCIVDTYPEIKYRSCQCAFNVASQFRERFQMCSGTLLTPLLKTITHQHSKTRIACIMAIGSVIQYGDNSGVKDVISHLAQRMFDSIPSVRMSVIVVVGTWLVELPDRYSFFPQLLSLSLSGLCDEVDEVRKKATELWNKAGEVYLKENENDYKDQLAFPEADPDDYPDIRPTFGCRILVQRYYSGVLSALNHDIGDWLPETRVKSAELLYKIVLHCEKKATMKLQMVLDCVVCAAKDEERKTVDMALKTAELIGYFIDSELWSDHLLKLVSEKPNSCHLGVLAATVQGHGRKWRGSSFSAICEVLALPTVCQIRKSEDQANLLLCIEALLTSAKKVDNRISYQLFSVLISVAGLSTNDLLLSKCYELLELLCLVQAKNSSSNLYESHATEFLNILKTDHELWTTLSPETSIFVFLIQECSEMDELVSLAAPIIISSLQPERDPKLRSLFLSLVKSILEKPPTNEDSEFSCHVYKLVHDGILPNLRWSAGKSAIAMRAIAIANLWEIIRTDKFSESMLQEIASDLLPILVTVTDDDLGTTRLLACRILAKSLPAIAKSVDEQKIHSAIQEFIRSLDDELDDARIAAVSVFRSYFNSFPQDYDWRIYRGHLQRIYKNMLVHMDDPKENVRIAIFDLLKEISSALPETLLQEVEAAKSLMSSDELCSELTEYIKNMNLNKTC